MADLTQIIQAAAQAALDNGSQNRTEQASQKVKGKGLSMPRALLVGAALFTAGRVLVRASGGDLVEGLQQRLEDFESQFSDSEDDDEGEGEYDDEPEAEYDDEEGPEGEYDDEGEPEAEYDDEPEGEYDEDEEEPEGEYDEDEEEAEERPRSRSRSASRASR